MAQGSSDKGWIALTHDRRIRYKPNELAAVVANRVFLLVVVGRAPFAQLARSFVASRARVDRFIAGHEPPCIAKLYTPTPAELLRNPAALGRLEKWYP